MPEIKLKGSHKPWTKSKKKQRSFKSNGKPNFEQFVPFYGSDAQQDKRYQSARWKSIRKVVLNDDPMCAPCMNLGRINSAAHVDHVRLHDTDGVSFYDDRNLWGLCISCHSVKSALESKGVRCPHTHSEGEAKQWWMEAVCYTKKNNQ